jgi:hypothetical protein
MKKDIKNVGATLLIILFGSLSTSVLYAKQVEVEDFAYYQEVVDAELARLEVSATNTTSCLTSEDVDRLVAAKLEEIIIAANALSEVEEAPVAAVPKTEAKPVLVAVKTGPTDAQIQAEAAAIAAKRAKEDAARLAAEDEASRLAAAKKARLEAEAAAVAAEKAAAKKASRQSQAS